MNVRTATLLVSVSVSVAVLAGCSSQTPVRPDPSSTAQGLGSGGGNSASPTAAPQGGPPGYEPAYYGGNTYWINAIEVPNHAPDQAQADLYEVVYPIGWEGMGLPPPQCDPCDHDGNGIDFLDYHDHVLDSMPGDPGHGEYTALWHVWAVVPAYNHEPAHDALVNAAYASRLPAKSEQAVDALVASRLDDGSPVAVEVNTDFYFVCAVVNQNAAH